MSARIYSDDFLEAYAEILVECWSDEDFKKRFIADPVSVFKEWEIDVEDGEKIEVVEVSEPGAVAISLPPVPEGFDQLSDEDLADLAGGARVASPPISPSGIVDKIGEEVKNIRPSVPRFRLPCK